MTDNLFRVRLNCVDFYQATPTDLDPKLRFDDDAIQSGGTPRISVLRVFGSTETGQKVCAHIHGALQYLFLEYDGSLKDDDVRTYCRELRQSIDHALATSYRRNPYDGKSFYVGHISLVKGIPFFGYHVGYKYFLKVYILNPLHMTRLQDVLQQGLVMRRTFQPYEAHMQYIAQWMCDYNLYGCAYLDCANVRFRRPVPDWLELNSSQHKWHDRSVSVDQLLDPGMYARQSHCSIEVDICVQDILNRKQIQERRLHHDFLERFFQLAPDQKFVHSMEGLWKDETRRRKRKMGLKDPTSSPFPPEVMVSMSADPRNTDKGGWIHEEEYRDQIEHLIRNEKKHTDATSISFDNFLHSDYDEDSVQTTLRSVEELYPANLTVLPLSRDREQDQKTNRSMPSETNSTGNGIGNGGAGLVTLQDGPPSDAPENLRDELQPTSTSVRSKAVAFLPTQGTTTQTDYGDMDIEALEFNGSAIDQPRRPSDHRNQNVNLPASKFGCGWHNGVEERDVAECRPNDSMRSSQELSQPPLSQGSIKAKTGKVDGHISFPVVKNPHDPDTVLRLSQRSRPSDSQKSLEIPKPQQGNSSKGGSSTITPWTKSEDSLNGQGQIRESAKSQVPPGSDQIAKRFALSKPSALAVWTVPPPTVGDMTSTLQSFGRPNVIYQDAYYSNESDVPERAREYAGQEFRLGSVTVPYLPPFDASGESSASFGLKSPASIDKHREDELYNRHRLKCTLRNWQLVAEPPSRREVEDWLHAEQNRADKVEAPEKATYHQSQRVFRKHGGEYQVPMLSQIEGPTQKNGGGFKYLLKDKSTSVQHETQYMSTMSLEVHVNTRGVLSPDPAQDEISSIFWCLQSDDEALASQGRADGKRIGILMLAKEQSILQKVRCGLGVELLEEHEELDLINRVVDLVREFDPDILTGYEVHNGSWGYLIERARAKYEFDLCDEFSRMKSQSHGRFGKEADRWGFNMTSTIRVTGRHMINIWRAMRGEINLLQYTMENVVFHLLHRRVPHYTFQDLTNWFQSRRVGDIFRVIKYHLERVQLDLEILDANELIARTSEQARLLGVDFFSVFSRGSQFKVESIMFRIAKPENFLLVSPSRKQVGQQNALECLPLVMEPQSAFYNSPLLVLDFQSLYPSIMIAYNYCYSTCLGRVAHWRGMNKLGFAEYHRAPRLLELVKDHINISPNGLMFVRPEMRKSLLAKMLTEILETRVMVKSGMKVDRDDRTLQQLLNNRQLALKLLANVTYGYTSASFSGRMPCAEIADAIVQTARETLEKTIAFIHSVAKWDAEVVYGDTDSLFIYLKGRTRDEAFKIGAEMAEAVTNRNPRPIKLKFEKVYHPCVLLAKKRYVGFKYESPTQAEPEFDAKGIETVRRDGTPAEQKIEEKALKILFRTADLSQVKAYFQRQCSQIMRGRVSIQDFCFAKEVKLGTYSERGVPPPGALIATRKMLADPRQEPQYGERVPYVVVAGAPGARLIDRCVAPEELMGDEEKELDAEYYISKNLIPPLERIFNLVGANVRQWYDEMPKVQRVRSFGNTSTSDARGAAFFGRAQGRGTLERYLQRNSCLVCRVKLPQPDPLVDIESLPLCHKCHSQPSMTIAQLQYRLQAAERKALSIESVCRTCAGLSWNETIRCDSRDCPVFFSRVKAHTQGGSLRAGLASVVASLQDLVARDGQNLAW